MFEIFVLTFYFIPKVIAHLVLALVVGGICGRLMPRLTVGRGLLYGLSTLVIIAPLHYGAMIIYLWREPIPFGLDWVFAGVATLAVCFGKNMRVLSGDFKG